MKIQLQIVFLLLIQLFVTARYCYAQTIPDHQSTLAAITDLPRRHDPELRKLFLDDYQAADRNVRPIFKQYFATLGADGILDVLEQRNALCHAEAHDLGKEILIQVQELGAALQICGNRCSSGCMHGLLWQAFAGDANEAQQHLSLETIKPKIKSICENKAVLDTYEPGNCAHGIGHGIMVLSGYELGEALQSCKAFETKPLEYYCVSGVFMEYDSQPSPTAKDLSQNYPCDTYKEFPSACYKYRTRHFLAKAKGNTAVVAEECSTLEPMQRHGCFYGLGATYFFPLAKKPERLATICKFGDAQDQAMCISGAVEYLADLQPATAQLACATLTGENAKRCAEAIRNKRYGLEKDFSLHYR